MTPLRGFPAFLLIGAGQLVSLTGSAMTGLALAVWAWQQTGDATTLTLLVFFGFAPRIVLSPLAGDLIDRLPRKPTLALADLGAGVSSIAILLLLGTNNLHIWHLYALALWSGAFSAFHAPTFAATIPSMVPEQHFARANGVLSLAQAGANVIAPALAGALLAWVGIQSVLIIDIVSFSAAVLTLLLVRIPEPEANADQPAGNYAARLSFGFHYILASPPLRNLLGLYAFVNLIGAVGMVLLAPLALARTNGSGAALGLVMAALGAGGILGGVLVSTWGGFRHRMRSILTGLAAVSVIGYGVTALSTGVPGLAVGAFSISFFVPLLSSAHQAIWQTHIPRSVQGRVFAARQALGEALMPVVMLGGGPLADALERSLFLRGMLGGNGAGIATLFLASGIGGLLVALGALLNPSMRGVEHHLAAQISDCPDRTERSARLAEL